MTKPSFQSPPTKNPYGFQDIGENSTPVFIDIDKDGDLDAFVGAKDGKIQYFKNIGTVTTPQITLINTNENPFFGVDVGEQSTPSFVDIDNDGDFDAFIGEKDGIYNFYRNNGTATSPSFSLVVGSSNPFNTVSPGQNLSPVFADIDGDGDFDTFTGRSNGELIFFRNIGTRSTPRFATFVTNQWNLYLHGCQ